jgi:HAD superfamily hydrolase (TIGR01509 family)
MMSTGSSRAIFLDLDGTLTDNLSHLYECYARFMAAKGLPHSKEEFERYNGTPLGQCLADFKAVYGLQDPLPRLVAEYQRLLEADYARQPPRESVVPFLEAACRAKVAVCIVTSAPARLAHSWRDANLAEELVQHMVCGDQVPRGKPDPAPYRIAIEATGADVDASFAVEDSANGIASAASAGLRVVQMKQAVAESTSRLAWRAVCDFSALMDCVVDV